MNGHMLMGIGFCAALLIAGTVLCDQKGGSPVLRRDLETIVFSDGSKLAFFARAFYPQKPCNSPVKITLCDKRGKLVWSTRFGALDYVPGNTSYYGLVKVMQDDIHLFSTWNGRHCRIDKRTGQIVEDGKSDDVLRRLGSVLPLKLTLIPGPSVGYRSPSK